MQTQDVLDTWKKKIISYSSGDQYEKLFNEKTCVFFWCVLKSNNWPLYDHQHDYKIVTLKVSLKAAVISCLYLCLYCETGQGNLASL